MQNISFSSPDQVYFINYDEMDPTHPEGTTAGWGASQVYIHVYIASVDAFNNFQMIIFNYKTGRRIRIDETSLRFHEYLERKDLR